MVRYSDDSTYSKHLEMAGSRCLLHPSERPSRLAGSPKRFLGSQQKMRFLGFRV